MTPLGEVIGEPSGYALELAANSHLARPEKSGTLNGWKRAVGAALSTEGCPHWRIGVAAGFAGSLLRLADLDTCGVNLSGLSTSGKTLAQKLSVSIWSSTTIGSGLLQSMRSTENAIEALAQTSAGTVLALDELGHADGKSISRMIYGIASGVGKSRLTANATLKDRYVWDTFAILSGECSLAEKVKRDGGRWTAGMAVRIVDVEVTGINRGVDEETLEAIAKINQNFGHAGPAFVTALVENGDHRSPGEIRDRVLRTARELSGEAADSATIRAATPFALIFVAGELAKSFGLIPKETNLVDAVGWAWRQFLASTDAIALKPEQQVVANLRTWIQSNWDVTIKSVEVNATAIGGMRPNSREAFGWYDEETVYVQTDRIIDAAGGVMNKGQIAKILDVGRFLTRRGSAKRIAVTYVPQIGHAQCYALRRSEFGRLDTTESPCQPDDD